MRITDLSRVMHDSLFRDCSQSLCARAWQYRHASRFWAFWVRVFGARHCRRSFAHYNGGEGLPND